jgi:hypothetical protein
VALFFAFLLALGSGYFQPGLHGAPIVSPLDSTGGMGNG